MDESFKNIHENASGSGKLNQNIKILIRNMSLARILLLF